MSEAETSIILLDFFGTMVEYSDSWTEQGYHQSHEMLLDMGAEIPYEEFLESWSSTFRDLNQQNAHSHREFSMDDVATIFLTQVLGREPAPEEISTLVATYGNEWDSGVHYPEWIQTVVSSLAQQYRLGVVSNTHHVDLVPKHLVAMGVDPYIDTVVTSIGHGYRKPHPTIYAEALERFAVEPASAVFVGDDYEADYVGPQQLGIAAFHINARPHSEVPDAARLRSLADLPDRLSGNT